ncbi:MAG: hypothetical protein IKU38_07195 [Clostridia bacterium]|nr:hypothetical protein [Clostridia bacterium]
MLQPLSPYALLCASKPKPTPTTTTEYDLMSLAHAGTAVSGSQPEAANSSLPAVNAPSVSVSAEAPLMKRTHYISDIHNRHANASKRAPQHCAPL